jgi:hypothetical protein
MLSETLANTEAIPVERPELTEDEINFIALHAGEINFIIDGTTEAFFSQNPMGLSAFSSLMAAYHFRLGQEYARRENG